uniref:Uncharacterized protein n=1 Tax=Suricata suricatta TaxID=37032 RepID=A0A673T8R8_SURSU
MQTPQKTQSLRPFKQRKSLGQVLRVAGFWPRDGGKDTVEHYPRERFLPPLDKTEFLVPQELTATQVLSILRGCLVLWASEGFSLLVNNKSLVSMNVIMAEVHGDYQDEDGFVDMTCAPQEKFGCLGSARPEDDSKLGPAETRGAPRVFFQCGFQDGTILRRSRGRACDPRNQDSSWHVPR